MGEAAGGGGGPPGCRSTAGAGTSPRSPPASELSWCPPLAEPSQKPQSKVVADADAVPAPTEVTSRATRVKGGSGGGWVEQTEQSAQMVAIVCLHGEGRKDVTYGLLLSRSLQDPKSNLF